MKKSDLTAKDFLKSQELREKYQCGICYQVCVKPVKCKGCSQIFCLKCVSDTRQNKDQCPMKCSSPFLVQRIPDIQLEFCCPYNPSLCEIPIKSVESFDDHYKYCQFMSPDDFYLKQLQLQYKCLKGHQLQFFVGTYQQMLKSVCYGCRDQKLCRSYCRICEHFYCVVCRIPPCSKEGCPIGHNFSFHQISNLNFICDVCGVSTGVIFNGVFDDNLCNFGICQSCYSSLPQKFDQSKPRSLIANVNTQCSCGTNLMMGQSYHKLQQCSLCMKFRQCNKKCTNCKNVYCLKCKIVDININLTCQFKHEFKAEYPSGSKSYIQKQHEIGCMRCGKTEQYYQYDHICKIRLCNECVEYCQKVTSDKMRPIITKCNNNHVLGYCKGQQDWYDQCYSCHQQKIIKLRCGYCSDQDFLNFCFQCKPIRLQTCYYKHPLRLAQFEGERQCHYCMKNNSKFHFCDICFFYVCEQCVQLNLNSYKMQIQGQQNQKIKQQNNNNLSCGPIQIE